MTIASPWQHNFSIRVIALMLDRSGSTVQWELVCSSRASGYGSAKAQCGSTRRKRTARPFFTASRLHSVRPSPIITAQVLVSKSNIRETGPRVPHRSSSQRANPRHTDHSCAPPKDWRSPVPQALGGRLHQGWKVLVTPACWRPPPTNYWA